MLENVIEVKVDIGEYIFWGERGELIRLRFLEYNESVRLIEASELLIVA